MYATIVRVNHYQVLVVRPVANVRHWTSLIRLAADQSQTRPSRASNLRSFEKNLCHHPFILMIKKVAVKHGHTPYHRVREIHDDVD